MENQGQYEDEMNESWLRKNAERIFVRLFRNEETMCSLLYGKHGAFAKRNAEGLSVASADMFFLEVIPVALPDSAHLLPWATFCSNILRMSS